MLLIEDSFSVENLFFYLKLLGKSLKEQKIMILPSGYQYSLWMMSSDIGCRMHTFIWKEGRMIDKASFASHGYHTPAGIPPILSLSAGGSKLGDPRLTALKSTDFPSCPKAGRANAAAEPPRCCSAKPEPSPDAPRWAEQVLLCPHDVPAEGWNWYRSWDDISCGQRMRIPVTINQQTEHLPRSLKGHLILNSSYPASRHLIH